MTKPILKNGVKLRKGVKLSPDNSLESRRERYRKVPKNIMSISPKNKKAKKIFYA